MPLRLLIYDLGHGRVLVLPFGQLDQLLHGRFGELVAHAGAGIDEGAARQLHAHHLHQHLVAVGGAVEGAGARAVVGGALGLQQLGPAHFTLGKELAYFHLLRIGQTRGHGAGGHKHHRQVAKRQGADHQTGNDLVADTEAHGPVEHVVRQRYRGGHGNHVAAEQRQVHAVLALGHTIAHGRHAAGHLGGHTGLKRRSFDLFGIVTIRMVGRQHVVVGGHNAEVGGIAVGKHLFFFTVGRGKAVRQIAAGEARPRGTIRTHLFNPLQIGGPGVAASVDNPLGNFGESFVSHFSTIDCLTSSQARRLLPQRGML